MKALRQIPPVNEILRRSELKDVSHLLSQPFSARLLDDVMGDVRQRLRQNDTTRSRDELGHEIATELRQRMERLLSPSLVPVINATGVVLHTNLGRAPLPGAAIDHVRDVSTGYSNLEFDIRGGRRGRRDSHVAQLVCELLGCESAIVVNNNAAAVLLVLNSLAEDKEVLVSRGEEIEIGGSFRIPEVMAKSGARLCEIGTTNRTRIEDYAAAIGEETRLLLRVHPSNFSIHGFTERPSLAEFAALGRSHHIPTFEDLGSGCLSELSTPGLSEEPRPQDSIAQGIDLVCFSGDKLMGGPQSGIVAGKKTLIEQIRRNPLFRALRVDKLTLASLESVLQAHLRGDAAGIPVLEMLETPQGELRDRAEALIRRIPGETARSAPMQSVVGGGSVPEAVIPSWGVAINPAPQSPGTLEEKLRLGSPPVITRIEDDQVLIDLRTVRRWEEDALLNSLARALSE